jgi:flavodoxin
MKPLLVLFSYHHHNTEKIANAIAKVLDAQIKMPNQISPEEIQEYDLVGFGSGIYDEKHHQSLLDLADRLLLVTDRKAFIFSTNGSPDIAQSSVERDRRTGSEPEPYATRVHLPLREKLRSKGYIIVGEFSCQGLNTNSFLRLFGGINKGRPNGEDLRHAEEFAQRLREKM